MKVGPASNLGSVLEDAAMGEQEGAERHRDGGGGKYQQRQVPASGRRRQQAAQEGTDRSDRIAAAQRTGPAGCVHAIDIEPKMIERVQARAAAEGVTNIQARVASAYELPYPDAFFDVIYMITVTGEIPDPVRAMREFRRVLKPSGRLAISEILLDPDYPQASTVIRWAAAAGLQPVRKIGNFFYYTLVFGPDSR